MDQKVLQDVLDIRAKVEEEGTGKVFYFFIMTHRCVFNQKGIHRIVTWKFLHSGVSLPQEKRVTISYVLGKVSFINVPKVWERGSNVEGKVSLTCCFQLSLSYKAHLNCLYFPLIEHCAFQQVRAVYHNNTPVCDAPVYLFTGQMWQTRSLQNLTTDSNGVASFSFSTDNFDQDIQLHVSWHTETMCNLMQPWQQHEATIGFW